jgi:hypothetical protein
VEAAVPRGRVSRDAVTRRPFDRSRGDYSNAIKSKGHLSARGPRLAKSDILEVVAQT